MSKSQPSPSVNEEEQLFSRYLEICNQALERHKHAFPYRQLWTVAQDALKNKTVSLAVYDDRPKVTYDLAVHDHHIDVVDKKHRENPEAWHVNMSYLEKVVAHPEEYINNPAKIDWDWLKSRLSV